MFVSMDLDLCFIYLAKASTLKSCLLSPCPGVDVVNKRMVPDSFLDPIAIGVEATDPAKAQIAGRGRGDTQEEDRLDAQEEDRHHDAQEVGTPRMMVSAVRSQKLSAAKWKLGAGAVMARNGSKRIANKIAFSKPKLKTLRKGPKCPKIAAECVRAGSEVIEEQDGYYDGSDIVDTDPVVYRMEESKEDEEIGNNYDYEGEEVTKVANPFAMKSQRLHPRWPSVPACALVCTQRQDTTRGEFCSAGWCELELSRLHVRSRPSTPLRHCSHNECRKTDPAETVRSVECVRR